MCKDFLNPQHDCITQEKMNNGLLIIHLFSHLSSSHRAPVWWWTSQWWVRLMVWSQTCWQTHRCPLTPAALWRLSAISSAPRSTSSHSTDLAPLQTPTPALTLKMGQKKQRDSLFQRLLLVFLEKLSLCSSGCFVEFYLQLKTKFCLVFQKEKKNHYYSV